MQRGYIYIFGEELRREIEIEIKMEEVERKNRRNRIGKTVPVIAHHVLHSPYEQSPILGQRTYV